jgi:hypothetical protein
MQKKLFAVDRQPMSESTGLHQLKIITPAVV